MAGDISRNTFNAQKHYSGVLMQQGRVQLDSDWNEQLAIRSYRTGTETKDVIGACGVPKKGHSFKITATADSADLNIAPGRIYVGGLLCELEGTTTAATYLDQPYYPNPDKTYFENPPASPPNSPVSSPPTPTPTEAELKDGTYVVYIDAWQREINYLDDPLIHEVALGEADTTTRLQNVWQVKLLQLENAAPTCNTDFEEWKNLTGPPSGKLNVKIKEGEDTKSLCELPPKSGYRRLENQLYRVEVQRGGNRATTTFKWSRDNASVETAIVEKVENNILTVADVGRDEVLGFAGGQWVEIVDEESTLKSSPQQLVQIVSVEPSRREITVSTSNISNKNNGKLKLRRWDQSGDTSGPNGLPASNGWIDLEDGIQVIFSDDTHRAGDYWLIPARTATGEVEWPPYEIPNSFPIAQLPLGIKHYYCKLALLQVQAGKITVQDCRPLFPSLTEICAEDVCYNNSNCKGLTGTTVQQALDELCQERDSACTLLALPGPGWEKVFDRVSEGGDAQVCFQVGDYPLDRPVNISNKGHIKLTGCGAGTKVLAPGSEAALVFSACKTVVIGDLYIETGLTGSKGEVAQHLNGTVTFTDCTEVNIKGVTLKCGSGTARTATCISVRNGFQSPCSVRIQNCNLNIGLKQQGILLVNAVQALVENNTLRTYDRPDNFRFLNLIKEKQQRAGIRKILIAGVSAGKIAPEESTTARGTTSVKLNLENKTLYLKTHSFLKNAWYEVIKSIPPAKTEKPKDLFFHAKALADRMLTDQEFRNRFPRFRSLFEVLSKQDQAVASQGITIGGQIATDVRILNNSIENCLQGIHVGISHRVVEGRSSPDLSEAVTIFGNTIKILLPADTGKLDRYGVFVGNCKNLIIENNTISINRLAEADNYIIDGIRVWGMLGERLMVTKNYLFSVDGNPKKSFDIGIHVHPLQEKPVTAQWVVMWNVAPSRQSTASVSAGAVAVPGTNTPS